MWPSQGCGALCRPGPCWALDAVLQEWTIGVGASTPRKSTPAGCTSGETLTSYAEDARGRIHHTGGAKQKLGLYVGKFCMLLPQTNSQKAPCTAPLINHSYVVSSIAHSYVVSSIPHDVSHPLPSHPSAASPLHLPNWGLQKASQSNWELPHRPLFEQHSPAEQLPMPGPQRPAQESEWRVIL